MALLHRNYARPRAGILQYEKQKLEFWAEQGQDLAFPGLHLPDPWLRHTTALPMK
jgi:hypothetical protein